MQFYYRFAMYRHFSLYHRTYAETAERNSTNLNRKQDLNVLRQVCVFPIRKTRWLPGHLIGYFRLLLWTAKGNSTKLDRKQDLNVLFQFCVYRVETLWRPGGSVKKVAHCTQVHNMWPFGPLVFILLYLHLHGWSLCEPNYMKQQGFDFDSW